MDHCTVQSCAQITQHDDIYIKFKSCLSNFFAIFHISGAFPSCIYVVRAVLIESGDTQNHPDRLIPSCTWNFVTFARPTVGDRLSCSRSDLRPRQQPGSARLTTHVGKLEKTRAGARTHVLTSALFARRISYARHASAVLGMRKIFLLYVP